MTLTTAKLRAGLAITGNETERRLVIHIATLLTERDIIKAELETEKYRWESYLDWLSWIEDHANDPVYGTETERLKQIADGVTQQEAKETPPFVDYLFKETQRLEADLKNTHTMLGWALGVVKKAQEDCHNDWCSDDDDHAAFCDYLTESLEKARTDLGVKKA